MVDNLHTIIFSFVYLRVLEPLWHSIFATKAQRYKVITKKNIANINHVLEFNVLYKSHWANNKYFAKFTIQNPE